MTNFKKYLRAGALALSGWTAMLGTSAPAQAQQSYFIGQMTWWAGNFAPRSWAECNGQILSINQNQALFSIIGTIYGGDGRTTFALPDMRGRAAIHAGSGPGLTPRQLGQRLGSENNVYTLAQLASHSHTGKVMGTTTPGTNTNVAGNSLGSGGSYANLAELNATMADGTVQTNNTGVGQSINNMQPSLTVNCIISLFGIFPSRN